MIHQMFEKDILLYVMAGLCGFGIILKIMIALVYHGLIKASDQMGTSKNKLMKLMRLKFEACYKLKIGVNNVDTFVDKYVYKHKFCGISLYAWENFSGQFMILCTGISIIGGILAIMYGYPRDTIFFIFLGGLSAISLLAFFESVLNSRTKKNIVKVNIKDYLENFLKARLENEYFNQEMVQEYRNEYFTQKEEKLESEEKESLKDNTKNISSEEEEDMKILKESLFKNYPVKETAATTRKEEKIRKNKKDEQKISEMINKVQPERQRETKKDKKNYEMSEKEEKIIEDILKEYLA